MTEPTYVYVGTFQVTLDDVEVRAIQRRDPDSGLRPVKVIAHHSTLAAAEDHGREVAGELGVPFIGTLADDGRSPSAE